jgi:hypothetical protein
MLEAITKPAEDTFTPPAETVDTSESTKVVLTFTVDLRLLHLQKRALTSIPTNFQLSADEVEAIEGMLNMIDFIQDSIVDQGLVSEEEVFPRMPLLFEIAA